MPLLLLLIGEGVAKGVAYPGAGDCLRGGEMPHAGCCKIMHVTACYIPCRHPVAASRALLGSYAGKICKASYTNFREFVFPDVGIRPVGGVKHSSMAP